MTINIKELRIIVDIIFRHLEDNNEESFDLENDFYWEISEEDLYDVEKKPNDFSIGQLSDDWNDLQMLLNKESDPISYYLVDLAAILKAIGQKIVI